MTKRKRKQYTGKTRSRSCMGNGARPPRVIPDKPQPSRKVARLNELYDNILEDAVDE